MTTIVTRAGKGSPLTHTEVDTNFTNLNTNKLEAGAIALGSAATPSISFTGDTNTGIYSPGADQVAISTGGSGRLFVGSNGDIQVGAASTLNAAVLSATANPASKNLYLAFNGTTTGADFLMGGISANANGTNIGAVDIYRDSSDNHGYISFRTKNGTTLGERVRIDSSGRLLVGTSSSPTVGDTQYGRIRTVGNTAFSSGFGLASIGRGEAASSITVDEEIGYLTFTDNAGGAFAHIECRADGAANTGDYPGRLVFSTTADGASSPTERVRITQQGYFKATSSGDYNGPTATYHESRTNAIGNVVHLFSHAGTSGNSYGIQITYAQNRGTQAGDQYIYCNDTAALRMEVRGNGGIANYQANNVNLSDRNAKKDISPAADTWNCIKEWEIVNYRYKDQPDDADLNLGVIAQQVAESCPEVITVFEEAKDDQPEKLGVKEQQMYWMAIKALQEAQVRIEALEAEVAALKAS